MHAVVLSGIRPSFPSLSRSAGQITHVLLTRSPLEYPAKGLSVRLACVKHAASVRPEPGSNSPNKNPHTKQRRQNSNQRKSDHSKKTPKTGIKKTTPPHTGSNRRHGKKTTTKTKPPNTLLSSQTTPRRPRNKTRGSKPLTRSADVEGRPPKWNFPLGHRRARRAGRVAATRLSYATGNMESNKLLDGVFRLASRSIDALGPGDVPLAAAQHQPPSVEEVGGLRRPGLVVDFGVVHVRPALGDRAPRRALAWYQPAGHEQVDDSGRGSRLQLGYRRLLQRRPQGGVVQPGQLTAPEQCATGVLDRLGGLFAVHECGELAGQSALRRPLLRPFRGEPPRARPARRPIGR